MENIELAHAALDLLIALAVQEGLTHELGPHEVARRGLAHAEGADIEALYAACSGALRALVAGRPRQDTGMLEGPAHHRLDPDQREAIFTRQIVPQLAARGRGRRAWLLVGPRGAGLGTRRLQTSSAHGAVEIAAGHLVAYHPHYAGLLETSDKTAEACVAAEAEAWAQSLLKHALAAGLPIVVEHTDPASESCADMLSSIVAAGYALEVHALAASHTACLLGVHRRYERLLAECGRAPFTLNADLVRAQRGVPVLLERLSLWPEPPVVSVFGRSGEALQRGARGAADRVRAEQERPLTAAEKAELAQGWLQVWRLKQARRAPRPDLEVVRAHQQRALREAFSDAIARSALDPESYQVASMLAR
jgi:hypothetical protein